MFTFNSQAIFNKSLHYHSRHLFCLLISCPQHNHSQGRFSDKTLTSKVMKDSLTLSTISTVREVCLPLTGLIQELNSQV